MNAVKAPEGQFDVKHSSHEDIIKDFHVPACRRPTQEVTRTEGAICE